MTPKWRLIWAVYTITAAATFLILEYIAIRDRTPGSVTLSEFGWSLMRNPVVNIAIIALLFWLLIHFAYKGRIL